ATQCGGRGEALITCRALVAAQGFVRGQRLAAKALRPKVPGNHMCGAVWLASPGLEDPRKGFGAARISAPLPPLANGALFMLCCWKTTTRDCHGQHRYPQ